LFLKAAMPAALPCYNPPPATPFHSVKADLCKNQ
jgi:hypothetical protein